MFDLANIYSKTNKTEKSLHYHLMAVDKNYTLSMIALGMYYDENNQYDTSIKYLMMAFQDKNFDFKQSY